MRHFALVLLLALPLQGSADGGDMVLIAKETLQQLLEQHNKLVEVSGKEIERLEKELSKFRNFTGCV